MLEAGAAHEWPAAAWALGKLLNRLLPDFFPSPRPRPAPTLPPLFLLALLVTG